MALEAEDMLVVLMVLDGSLPDPDILSLGKAFELLVQHLAVPDLTTLIKNSHLRRVSVELDDLDNLHLQVEVELPLLLSLLDFELI